MNRSSLVFLVAIGAAGLPGSAAADFEDLAGSSPTCPILINPRTAEELKQSAARLRTSAHVPNDTTWVGYNPAYAGSNYWSIGVGHRRPPGNTSPVPDADTGYWDWDHPVHGDSLQGWWPMRHNYSSFFIANLTDRERPWHAIDVGNSISYVINQGPGFRRTYGVTSAWHSDPGLTAKTADPGHSDVNPNPPRWTPLAGSRSAWCGLRAHGDVTVIDDLTGNPYNTDALEQVHTASPTVITGAGWTSYRFPGYADQWDQMLYRDVDISGASGTANVSVSFRFRTRMSTGKNTNPTTRTGWFDKDPLAVTAGNFISATDANLAAPIDSFMVYVGCPVADTAGAAWTGSDGMTHQVFDPVRRWFGELIRANDANGHYELFTTYGNDPTIAVPADSNAFRDVVAARNVTYDALRAAWGNRIRLVFRVKTNRGREVSSSDETGSLPFGPYTSGYLGAAQVDNVAINLGSGAVPLGGFENDGDIDNGPETSALDAWKTSSKPPAVYFHVHDLSDLTYEDICGPPGSPSRICNMAGRVISMGDHDRDEAADGPFGTAEQEHFQGMFSPTINLAYDPGNPTAKNNMGLDADTATPTSDWVIGYDIYSGYFDAFNLGQFWQAVFQSYPATQSDGTRTWGQPRLFRCENFNPDKVCFGMMSGGNEFGQVRTSNPNGYPDSLRIGLRKVTHCWRFGITTECGSTLGGYIDNVSLGLIDSATQPISVLMWEFWNDTFPANETAGLPGLAAFDTTAALIKTGLNTAQLTGDLTRYDVPGDTTQVDAPGDSVEVQLKFRILPGPGNYIVAGDPCSGLRRVPADTARITVSDGSFWTEYILNPGKDKDVMPTAGPCEGGGPLRHDQRWSELTWCNARCDTAERNIFPIMARGIGDPQPGTYASMYHEDDSHLAALGLSRRKCFLVDTLGAENSSNITCSTVPAWVTVGGLPYKTGYPGDPMTVEGTKVIPDGILTPGSHVEYFYVKKDLATGVVSMCPDTNLVYPQQSEFSLDAHRWQQFSVLPDAWKFASYGGLGKACMLYVDWNDRNGTEPVWVSVADSIGATVAAKRGSHNGWTAPGGADINDPAYFVNKNAQPGTTWDMYGVKAAESFNGQSGSIGSRLAYRAAGTYLTDKWAKNAPTPAMMAAYYRILMILSGDLNTDAVIGPFSDRSQDDTEFIRQFVVGATAGAHRGLFVQGDSFAEDLDANGNTVMQGLLSVSLREASYVRFSGNYRTCIDLIPTSAITTNGDIYGIRSNCLQSLDVLQPQGEGVAASYYDPVGANPVNAPYVASVFTDAEPAGHPNNHWQALIDGFDTATLRSRLCDGTSGRLAYFWTVFNNVFGKICAVAGTGPQTVEVPNNGDGKAFVDLAGIGNNPLRAGSAVIHLTLAQADRVTVKIYDVSGRLVRTLADGQMFKAGKVDPALTWDGLDDGGRGVARGAYFVSVRYRDSRFETTRKLIVLR